MAKRNVAQALPDGITQLMGGGLMCNVCHQQFYPNPLNDVIACPHGCTELGLPMWSDTGQVDKLAAQASLGANMTGVE